MTFSDLFRILLAKRWTLAVCAVTFLCLGVALRFLLPPSFKAVASIVVDPRGINPVSGAATQEPMAQDSVVGTYANIARSEGVARQVVSELNPQRLSKLRSEWQQTHVSDNGFEAWAARRILKGLDVRAGGQSSHVLDLAFTSRDAEDAANLANAFAHSLIGYAQTMRTAPARQNADFFAAQAKELQKQVVDAEQRLALFQRTNGIISADERTDVETSRLAALSSQVLVSQAQAYDSATRARLATGSAVSPDVVNNPLVQSMTAELAKREARLKELSSNLGGNHPDIQTAREQVDEARATLTRESRKIAASLNSSTSIDASRGLALRSDSAQQRSKVIELSSLRIELAALDRDVAQKRKLYELASQRSSESLLEASNQQGDVRLLTTAVPPDERAGPSAAVTLPLSLIVGLLLGTIVAISMERLSPRIYCLEDIQAFGMEVLETVPVARLLGTRSGASRRLPA